MITDAKAREIARAFMSPSDFDRNITAFAHNCEFKRDDLIAEIQREINNSYGVQATADLMSLLDYVSALPVDPKSVARKSLNDLLERVNEARQRIFVRSNRNPAEVDTPVYWRRKAALDAYENVEKMILESLTELGE